MIAIKPTKKFLNTALVLVMMLLCSWFTVQGQKVVRTIPLKADYLEADNLGNIYALKADEVTKMDRMGKQLEKYSNKQWGSISAFDASNPMKLLAHYRDLTRIAFLDNRLSPRGEPVALDEIGLDQGVLACTSHSNGFWVYDQIGFELVRLDQELRVDLRTGNLAQLLRSELQPVFLFELNNWLYMHDEVMGVLVFDIYGTYFKTIPLRDPQDLHLREGQLFYRTEKFLTALNLRTQEPVEWPLPQQPIKQFLTTGKQWYFLTDEELLICETPVQK